LLQRDVLPLELKRENELEILGPPQGSPTVRGIAP
jgi:hypothetical protein